MRARYKQAILGFGWALITPVVLMVVFTLFLRRVTDIDTRGVPYPIFSYVALLPWSFFSSAVNTGGISIRANYSLLNKVPCPREVFPISNIVVAAIDTTISTSILGLLFVIFSFTPKATAVWVPLLLLIQLAFTLGVTLFLAASVVYLRDIRHALPLVLQLWLFATPVAYGIDAVPWAWQQIYSILNPLAPVIEGYRRAILYGLPPDWSLLLPAAGSSLFALVFCYAYFKRLEVGFADVA